MELNHLRYFYEVAKAGSFTEAARQLRISQSALSKTVATLEDSEGATLLFRSKRGVSLTPLGIAIYSKCESIFRSVEEIQSTMRGTKEVCEGYLRIGASDHIANYLLIEELQKIRAQHPKLISSIFTATSNELLKLLLSGELEFSLFFSKLSTPGILYESLGSFPMVVVCHPEFLQNAKKIKKQEAISRAGFISSIKKDYQKHPSQPLFDLTKKDPIISFESNNQETQKRLCLAGGGIAFLARFMVEQELKDKLLVELPSTKPISLEIWIARKRELPLSLSARTLLQAIAKRFNLRSP